MVVTFDFDSTLALYKLDEDYGTRFIGPNEKAIQALKKHYKDGNIIYVVTSRKEDYERRLPDFDDRGRILSPNVEDFLHEFGVSRMIEEVYYTNGNLKRGVLNRLESAVHYDDDEEELEALPGDTRGMQVEFTTGNIKPWNSFEVRYPAA